MQIHSKQILNSDEFYIIFQVKGLGEKVNSRVKNGLRSREVGIRWIVCRGPLQVNTIPFHYILEASIYLLIPLYSPLDIHCHYRHSNVCWGTLEGLCLAVKLAQLGYSQFQLHLLGWNPSSILCLLTLQSDSKGFTIKVATVSNSPWNLT